MGAWAKQLFNGKGLASDTTGVKASYTTPSSFRATLRDYRITRITGGTVDVEYASGANVWTIQSGAAAYNATPNIVVPAGDVVRVNVTAAGAAGSVFDTVVSGQED